MSWGSRPGASWAASSGTFPAAGGFPGTLMRAIAHIIRRLSILAALLVASTSAAAAPEQDPDAIAERADRALASLQTLEAHFVQRVANPVLEKTEIGHGVLYYRAPGRYRIEYTYPRGDVVVDDGTWAWIYL